MNATMNARNGYLLALLTLLSACARDDDAGADTTPVAQDSIAAVAPPIIALDEAPDQAQPPSYEVSIASAASSHNKALERCERQPEAVRTQCKQEANAAFAEVESGLEPLRGNPE
jgi:hypothetical protein